VVVGTAAHAQGYQLQQYEPAAAGDGFFSVSRPDYRGGWAAALSADLGKDPLLGQRRLLTGSYQTERTLITSQLAMHLDLSASFLDRLQVSASLPLTLSEAGTGGYGVAPASGVVGDPRLGFRARVWGAADPDALNLNAGADVWVPIGVEADHAGDSGARAALRIGVAGRSLGWMRWAAQGGFLFRKTASLNESFNGPGTAGNALQAGVAAAYVADSGRWQAGPELTFATAAGGNAFKEGFSQLELLLGGQWQARQGLSVGPAIGFGLIRDAGTPSWRGLLRVTATSALFGDRAAQKSPPVPVVRAEPAPAAEKSAEVAQAGSTPAADKPEEVAQAESTPAAENPEPVVVATAEPAPVHPAPVKFERPAPALEDTGKRVHFHVNAAALRPEDEATLDAIAAELSAHPAARLSITGYGDESGPETWNQNLSELRAREVRRYLVAHGVDGKRIELKGVGSANPVAPNDSPEGRAENRRAELRILAE
jgi:outer membrane protein OmpA-like peptidoglycan-associated protein